MRTNKVLTIAVILLLLVNVALVIFMLKGKKHREPAKRGDMIEKMKKEIGMTAQQEADFKRLKAEHFKNVGPVFDSIRTLKKTFFDLVKADSINDSLVNNFSHLIAEQQAIVDKTTINHFRTVRALFTGDQLSKYDEFIQKMMQRRMKGGQGGKGSDSTDKK